MSKFSLDGLTQLIGDPDIDPFNAASRIEISKNSDLLIEYNALDWSLVFKEKNNENLLKNCLDFSAILPVTIQIYHQDKESGEIISKSLTDLRKHEELLSIFKSDEKNKIYFIPDTNILIRRYGINYLLPFIRAYPQFEFKIPRLVILELENLAKYSKKNTKKIEKRKSFSAFAEILRLRENGAKLLPQINPSLLQSFSNIAGKGQTDAWIRREIHDFVYSYNNVSNVSINKTIFLTSDLMNALAAIAEGIPTGYLTSPSRLQTKYKLNNESLARFIIGLAIFFEDILMKVEKMKKTLLLKVIGAWTGKTIDEWKLDIIEITETTSGYA